MRNNGDSAVARLDGKMKNELREKGSKINKELLLNGLYKPFPKNCISLMTISGAKGSSVSFLCDFIQSSCTCPFPRKKTMRWFSDITWVLTDCMMHCTGQFSTDIFFAWSTRVRRKTGSSNDLWENLTQLFSLGLFISSRRLYY